MPDKPIYLLTSASFFLAAVFIPVGFLLEQGSPRVEVIGLQGLALTALLISAGRLSWMLLVGAIQPITMVVWMFTYIVIGVVPMAELSTGIFVNLEEPGYLTSAEGLLLAAPIAFEVGRLCRAPFDARRNKGTFFKSHRASQVSVARLDVLSVLSVVFALYYIKSVGLTSFFASREMLTDSIASVGLASSDSQVGATLVGTLGQVPIFISALVSAVRMIRDPMARTPSRKWWLVLLVALNLVVNNPISNARYWVLTVIIGCIFASPSISRRMVSFAVTVGIAGALIVFPYADLFRRADPQAPAVTTIAQKLATKDYDQLTMTANGIWWINSVGPRWGEQLLGSVLFWVPRQWWPSKPEDTGVAIGTAMRAANTNLSGPLPLEFYVDFGVPGTLVGFILLGFITRGPEARYARSRNPNRKPVLIIDIAVPLVAGYGFILMRGSLLQAMSKLSVMILVLVVLIEHAKPAALASVQGDEELEESERRSETNR